MTEKIRTDFLIFYEKFLGLLPNLVAALIVLALFFFAGKLFERVYEKRLRKQWKDNIFSRMIGELLKWGLYLFGFIVALHILGFGGIASSVLAGAGISAIIVGFAFKDIAENFLAGLLLGINRPFNINDIIEVENYKGIVKGLDLRTTHLRIADGRDIFIPNSMILKTVLTNFTKDGLIRLDFTVGLDTNCNTEKARQLIMEKLVTLEEFGLLTNPAPNVIILGVGVSTIDLQILFWYNAFKIEHFDRALQGELLKSRVIREVVVLLGENGFTFPSQVIEHKMYNPDEPLEIQLKSKQ